MERMALAVLWLIHIRRARPAGRRAIRED